MLGQLGCDDSAAQTCKGWWRPDDGATRDLRRDTLMSWRMSNGISLICYPWLENPWNCRSASRKRNPIKGEVAPPPRAGCNFFCTPKPGFGLGLAPPVVVSPGTIASPRALESHDRSHIPGYKEQRHRAARLAAGRAGRRRADCHHARRWRNCVMARL